MDVGDLLQAKWYCRLDEQLSVNSRWYRITTKAGTGSTATVWIQAIASATADLLKDLLVDNATFLGMTGQLVTPTSVGDLILVPDGDPGNVAGHPLPGQCCGLIKYSTGLAGRKYRGRNYIPFPSEADSDETHSPITTYIDRLDLLATQVIAARVLGGGGNTNTSVPVLTHTDLSAATPITGFTSRQHWATQRSRGSFGAADPFNPV